jgi:hypothetical protein
VRAYLERDSLWTAPDVSVDGKVYSFHFFVGYSDLPDAMKSNPEAAQFADAASSQMIWGNSLLFGGLAGALVYLNQSNPNYGTYWLIFLSGFVPGILLHAAAEMNINKAINTYNGIGQRSALLPDKMFLVPMQDGGVAALSWSF